jgi:CubicO group peptidase (beta-lactamase class C family)/lysophospholipase L1-like esterase/ketosteroid isomerase-like protein
MPALADSAQAVPDSAIDPLFSDWTTSTPGCAVGVSQDGKIVLERAYGMADLEHDVANRPDTIFEAGSVSKQFTAAAVLLLERDGKLSLDDPVRKYIPELPDYGAPITIREMLQHTSGLRDWGNVVDVAGWPRGTRVHTHAHVLDVLSRQSKLNFEPGTRWSYSNSGYNLAAILVSRVAGEPFAEFTRKRIFVPLGMTRTSWRDDYARVVKGRAIAYSESDGTYREDMPFENVHGNGGLLTTVGDLLRWNANFDDPEVGDADLVREMQASGKLANGSEFGYGMGLSIDRYKGLPEVRHSGTTASYRAYLSRFPDQNLSVAVLCNAGDSTPRQTLHAVADLYLRAALKADPAPKTVSLSSAELDAIAGLWRRTDRGDTFRIVRNGKALQRPDGVAVIALTRKRLTDREGNFVNLEGPGRGRLDIGDGSLVPIERVEPAKPTAAELETLAGRYSSSDAETTLTVRVRDGTLEITRRPDSVMPLIPLYADAFDSELGTIIFRRDGAGRVNGFSVVEDRVWDLRFQRQSPLADAKHILVYGDSNTWGWIPILRGIPTTRYPASERWPGVARAELGPGYDIVEEGLSGRTTDLADSTWPQVSGAGMDGSAYLSAAVASHLPLDLVIVMLGTNDLKAMFDRSPEQAAEGVRKLIELVGTTDGAVGTEYLPAKVLVLAPPPLVNTERFPAEVYAGAVDKSRKLAELFEAVARASDAEFLDVGAITAADGVDGLHLSAAAHERIGKAVAVKIRSILGEGPAAADEGPTIATLTAQADAWDKAIVRKDRAAVESNMAGDFRQIDGNGNLETKASFVEGIVSDKLTIDPYTVEDFEVRLYGDVALLSGRTRMTGRYEGKDFTSHYRYIDTYVRRDGAWKIVSVQITKIPQ